MIALTVGEGSSSSQACQRSGSSPHAMPETPESARMISSFGMSPGWRSRPINVSAPIGTPAFRHWRIA